MQMFDFRCNDCEHIFEGWDTIDRTANPQCPTCQGSATVRLISKPRIDYTNMAVPMSGGDGSAKAIDKWAKRRAEKVKIEERNLRNHGTEI